MHKKLSFITDYKFLWSIIILLFVTIVAILSDAYIREIDILDNFNMQQGSAIMKHPIGETVDFKSYRNSTYGITLRYPETSGLRVVKNVPLGAEELGGSAGQIALDDFQHFNAYLNDGAFQETLLYDEQKNKWIIKLGTNQTAADAFCPEARLTTSQLLPYYKMGDLRTGRIWNYVFVTKKGVIVLSEMDNSSGINPAEVKFDLPSDVLNVSCDIK